MPSPLGPGLLLPRADRLRRALTLSAVVLAAVLASAPAALAEPAPETADGYERVVTPAEYYADELAALPEDAAVIVDDALAGQGDVATLERELHELFSTLDVPYHVIVSPFPGAGRDWGSGALLPPVMDRLGRDGLYVHLSPDAPTPDVRVRGYDLPVEESARGLYDDPRLEYDSGVGEIAAVLVERLLGEAPDPVHGHGERDEPGALARLWSDFRDDVDPTRSVGAENLGTLAGLCSGFVLGAGGIWVWWRSARGRRRRHEAPVTAVLTLVLAGAAVAGPYAYMMSVPKGGVETAWETPEPRSAPPYVVNTERVERLVAETGAAPLYVAPLVTMDRTGLAATAELLAESDLPVRALVMSMSPADESEGDPEVLAYSLAALTEGPSVYLVATTDYDGRVAVAAGTAGTGADPFALSSATRDVSAPTPAEAIEEALSALSDLPTDPGGADTEPLFAHTYDNDPGPRSERFFGDGFLPCLIVVGPLLAGLVFGGVLLTVLVVRGTGAGRRTRMGTRALRRLALSETRAMVGELEAAEEGGVPAEALRDADAALVVLRRPADALDLLGVTVLARRARAGISGDRAAARRPVCAANPLHGAADRNGRVPGFEGRRPLCEACRNTPDDARRLRVLELRIGGAWVAHLTPDRVWVRTNYGSTARGLVDGILEESDA
ncbi:hypothetical protein ABZ635_14850 [Nocardiopsis sp. NPDC007018]|uniref:hypothetical protein n=1 Tax=Nocardiopsis sp. NPDC007018 TaxID=3155721 RepID=UPI0033D088EA